MAPRWTFENKITFGNVLTIVLALVPAIWAYAVMAKQVDTNATTLVAVTERLNAKDAADAALLAALNADRVAMAGKLSEMATDIRYLRRSAEAEKRGELAE